MTHDVAFLEALSSAAAGAVAAIGYSAVYYNKNRVKKGESFNPEKAAATLVVGVLIGFGSGLAGVEVTEDNMFMYLLMYAGVISVVEGMLKAVFQRLAPPAQSPNPPEVGRDRGGSR